MVLLDEALALVNQFGTEVQRSRLAYIRDDTKNNTPIIQFIEEMQLPEGGFPYQAQPGNPYNLSYTSNIMRIMAEVELNRAKATKRTVDFVISVQDEDGFWDENPELASQNPPFWDQPGDLNTQLWLTGALADGLIRLGQGSSFNVVKAGDFLLRHRKPDGTFKGFRHTTWLAVAVLAPRRGITDSFIRDAVNALGAFGDWDPVNLNWALDCLSWAGIPEENEVVQKLLNGLIDQQRPDGHWPSGEDPDDKISQTVESLITLTHYSRI